MQKLNLNEEQRAMLAGEKGAAKQMAMRLIVDLAAAAGAEELASIQSAHISGVSPLTGGMGLLQFLRRLTQDNGARVAVATTLNAAGCDFKQFQAMHIAVPGFLDDSQEIVSLYKSLGISSIQSCIPYEWNEVTSEGVASWAESNAICYGNSYAGLITNRDSGLSALASALTGYTPKYGLLEEAHRQPNLKVLVSATMKDPTDYSILGDWIGKQLQVNWEMPYGPIPLICGLPRDLGHDQRKALSAAAANYGSAMLYIEEVAEDDIGQIGLPVIEFTDDDLQLRYEELRPRQSVSLIVIGCPQASVSELRAAAELLRGRKVAAKPGGSEGRPPIWIFTSAANKGIAERTGISTIFEDSGALFLENTCPEVVPYDQSWVKHVLTNSMKAEHYISSGINGITT